MPGQLSPPARLPAYLRLMKRKAAEGHLSVGRQLAEMLVLWLVRGLGPGYYLFGRFWRRELPLGDKLRHLNERAYERRLDQVNNPSYRKMSQHKVAEKAMLRLFGIPTPRFIGYLHSTEGRCCNGDRLRDAPDLATLLEAEQPTRICFKQPEGWSGIGFEAAEVDYGCSPPQLRPLPDGDPLDIASYLDQRLGFGRERQGHIIEEYCSQQNWYRSLNPTSVNTLRVYAILRDDRTARILGGYLRVGRQNAVIDNASAGGVFFPFDPATGVLAAGRFNTFDTDHFPDHPDSGVRIEGCRLPGWEQISRMAGDTLRVFPGIRFAGLDIAMTDTGPCVIEINVEPDKTAACDIDLPTLDMLNP